MPENMHLSVNGESQVPPGFRFHPTEEELLLYYLRKKVSNEKIDLDVILEVDLNKLEPWDIQERCKIGTTPQTDWYVFSHKDKKYPTGTRTNRATRAGFWKATGRDKLIYSVSRQIGMRKTLVFYAGRAPHGRKSSWIMHEYRFDDNISVSEFSTNNEANVVGDATQEDGWVVCRLFQKKNHQKTPGTPLFIAPSPAIDAGKDQEGISEETVEDMDKLCKEDDREINSCSRLLEPIDCSFIINNGCHPKIITDNNQDRSIINQVNSANQNSIVPATWVSIDHLVASLLNCDNQTAITVDHSDHHLPQLPTVRTTSLNDSIEQDYNDDYSIWSFLDDPFCQNTQDSLSLFA